VLSIPLLRPTWKRYACAGKKPLPTIRGLFCRNTKKQLQAIHGQERYNDQSETKKAKMAGFCYLTIEKHLQSLIFGAFCGFRVTNLLLFECFFARKKHGLLFSVPSHLTACFSLARTREDNKVI